MAERRLPQLLVMNREDAEAFIAGPDDVCISIKSPAPTDEPAKLSANFRAVLRVAFHDWPWPNAPEGGGQITAEDADKIVAFALAHRTAKRLVIHCAAGVSRSVSTAQALSVHLGRSWWFPRWFRPEMRSARAVVNPEVFNAIADAFARACPGERVIKTKPRERGRSAIMSSAVASDRGDRT